MAASRLVFLHGFTQTHHHWHGPARAIAGALAGDHTLAFVDLPGHGLSSAERIAISSSGEALAKLGGSGTWVGYSMGARFALHAALAPTRQIERLVLIGATAGIVDDHERAERRVLDEQRATAIENRGVDEFLEEWLSMPMFDRLPADDGALVHRRRNSAGGLISSLRLSGTGTQESVWHRLREIDLPVLLLAGERDQKFVGIAEQMAAALPNAVFATIEHAAHAAHTEQPEAVAEAIRVWVQR